MLTVLVEDMACQHCADSITKEIMAIEGVESVQANVNTGQVRVQTAPRSQVELAYIEDAIHRAGYTMAS